MGSIIQWTDSRGSVTQINFDELLLEASKKEVELSESEKYKANIIDSILNRYNERAGFHGNVLVKQKGKVLLNKAYGIADFSTGDSLETDHRFQLASVSKQFTAVAILQLCEKGKLSLQDSVHHILKEFPFDNVTVEHLLHHTAGMPIYWWYLETFWNDTCAPDNDDLLRLMNQKKANQFFTPGRKFDYSNTGYVLLASIVERVSGLKFDAYCQKNIFEPAGMNETYIYSACEKKEYPKKLIGYQKRWRYYSIDENVNDGTTGDKNVYSTTYDLHLWDEVIQNRELIADSLWEQAFVAGKTRWGWDTHYGYGFRINEDFDTEKIYHNGIWNGFKTGFVRYPEYETTIIFLSHTSYRYKSALQKRIEEEALFAEPAEAI